MDPRLLAESAVDLNVSLMRWRAAPELGMDRLREARCLLLGAGKSRQAHLPFTVPAWLFGRSYILVAACLWTSQLLKADPELELIALRGLPATCWGYRCNPPARMAWMVLAWQCSKSWEAFVAAHLCNIFLLGMLPLLGPMSASLLTIWTP